MTQQIYYVAVKTEFRQLVPDLSNIIALHSVRCNFLSMIAIMADKN